MAIVVGEGASSRNLLQLDGGRGPAPTRPDGRPRTGGRLRGPATHRTVVHGLSGTTLAAPKQQLAAQLRTLRHVQMGRAAAVDGLLVAAVPLALQVLGRARWSLVDVYERCRLVVLQHFEELIPVREDGGRRPAASDVPVALYRVDGAVTAVFAFQTGRRAIRRSATWNKFYTSGYTGNLYLSSKSTIKFLVYQSKCSDLCIYTNNRRLILTRSSINFYFFLIKFNIKYLIPGSFCSFSFFIHKICISFNIQYSWISNFNIVVNNQQPWFGHLD